MRFDGDGSELDVTSDGSHVIWVRARWEPGSRSALRIQVDGGESREARASTMIGFGDWTDPGRAYTKGFVHFPAQAEEWTWYRIVGPELKAGGHRVTLSGGEGMCLDAVVMLPQTPAVDRAATNLLANWNYAPWDNPEQSARSAQVAGGEDAP